MLNTDPINFNKTDFLLGEYEETIARSFVRSANLRRILDQTGTPEVIQNCKPIFQKLLDPQVRGTLVTDMLSFAMDDFDNVDSEDTSSDTTNPKIPDSLMECLLERFGEIPKSISLLPNLTMKGIIYSAASRHVGNSSVLIHSGRPGVLIPAQIQCFVELVLPDNTNTPVTYVVAQRTCQRMSNVILSQPSHSCALSCGVANSIPSDSTPQKALNHILPTAL